MDGDGFVPVTEAALVGLGFCRVGALLSRIIADLFGRI